MNSLPNPISRLLSRWSKQQESALGQMTKRKTVRQRLAGYMKSERVDAKFLLSAVLPFAPVALSDELGWERGVIWYGWFWLSAAWAATVLGIGSMAYWRSVRRSMREKR